MDLLFFGVTFIISMMAFSMMLYVQLGHVMEGFVTQTASFISLFRALFGDFDIDEIMNNSRGYLNTCLFLVYLFVAVFILLSMFLALLAEAQVAVREQEAMAKENPSYREFGILSHTLDAAKGCRRRMRSGGKAEDNGEESEGGGSGAEGGAEGDGASRRDTRSPDNRSPPSPTFAANAIAPAAGQTPTGPSGNWHEPSQQQGGGGGVRAGGASPDIGSDEALSIMVNEIRKLQGQIELLRSQVSLERRSDGGRRGEGRVSGTPARSPVLRPDTRMMPVWSVVSDDPEPASTFPTFNGGGGGPTPGPRVVDYRDRNKVSLNA